MMYVSKKHEEKILEATMRYRRIQNLLNQLSERNLKKILEER